MSNKKLLKIAKIRYYNENRVSSDVKKAKNSISRLVRKELNGTSPTTVKDFIPQTVQLPGSKDVELDKVFIGSDRHQNQRKRTYQIKFENPNLDDLQLVCLDVEIENMDFGLKNGWIKLDILPASVMEKEKCPFCDGRYSKSGLSQHMGSKVCLVNRMRKEARETIEEENLVELHGRGFESNKKKVIEFLQQYGYPVYVFPRNLEHDVKTTIQFNMDKGEVQSNPLLGSTVYTSEEGKEEVDQWLLWGFKEKLNKIGETEWYAVLEKISYHHENEVLVMEKDHPGIVNREHYLISRKCDNTVYDRNRIRIGEIKNREQLSKNAREEVEKEIAAHAI